MNRYILWIIILAVLIPIAGLGSWFAAKGIYNKPQKVEMPIDTTGLWNRYTALIKPTFIENTRYIKADTIKINDTIYIKVTEGYDAYGYYGFPYIAAAETLFTAYNDSLRIKSTFLSPIALDNRSIFDIKAEWKRHIQYIEKEKILYKEKPKGLFDYVGLGIYGGYGYIGNNQFGGSFGVGLVIKAYP